MAKPIPPERAASDDAAKEAALRILARGPRTEREIADRLVERGYVPDAVERAVERLRRVSLLDDREFVRTFVRHELLRKPQGRRLLTAKMKRRGVPLPLLTEWERTIANEEDLAERCLETEEGRARAAAEEIRRRLGRRTPVERRRRLEAGLLRRGFGWDTIRDLIESEPEEDA
ncbi:MAG TPA: regulatory protein RecX [Candidatus Eisenbacteria bacterium]